MKLMYVAALLCNTLYGNTYTATERMETMHTQKTVDVILTDIEGTTTSISFVHDILFPYAKKNMRKYLQDNQDEPKVSQLIQEIAQMQGISPQDLSHITEILLLWMEEDRKITPLKTLQGMMWKKGYEQGHLKGHVYLDAFEQLQQWHNMGINLYVYSSGSVAAQRLLFSYCCFGDITSLFSGYFDTHIGNKKKSSSYVRIAEKLHVAPEKILFLSDVLEELDAAAAAGMQTLWIIRDENIPLQQSCHRAVTSFRDVFHP